MDGPRIPKESELNKVIHFFDDNLRPDCDWSIDEEYPLVMTSENLNNFRVISDGDKILSGAVTKNLLIKNPIGIFKVAGIGSVVTHEQFRNQGLSRSVLDSTIQLAKDQGCDFAILWTSLHDFYRKVGFEVAGTEVHLSLHEPLNLSLEAGERIHEGANVSPGAILRLYSKHTTGSVRTTQDIREHLKIPNSRVFTLWDKDNQLRAYAVEGKGADLQSYVHEWGGEVPQILRLLSEMRSRRKDALHVLSPLHCENFIRQLKSHGAIAGEGILGMIRVLNFENLMFKIKRAARFMGEKDFVFEKRDGVFFLGTSSNLFQTDSETDLIRLIFGPQKAMDLHKFDPHTARVLETVLPIPMWVWGWDSV